VAKRNSNIIHPNFDERRAEERLKFVTTRIRIFIWQEREQKQSVEGMAFLSDLSKEGIGLYVGKELKMGRRIWVAFEKAEAAPFEAKSVWCQRFSLDRNPFKQKELSFRAGVKWVFGSDIERKRYLAFLQEIKNRALGVVA